jgi:hypothetical protein
MSVLNPNPQATYPAQHAITRTAQVQLNPVITTASAYTALNCVGGKLVFANIAGPQQSGIIQNVTVACKTTQTTGYKLYLFTGNPGVTTIVDKATPALSNTDLPYLMDVITISTADNSLTGTINTTDNIGRAFVSVDRNLYGILVVSNTPTYTGNNDLYVTLTVLQD